MAFPLPTAPVRRHQPSWTYVPLLAVLMGLIGACGLFNQDEFIVYAVGEEGARNIVVARGDGQDRRVVVAHPADDFSPVWSHNRDRIAFLSNRDGNVEIYITTTDGANLVRVTNTDVDESQPTWSPDGTRLAYTSPDQSGKPQVFWVRIADLLPNRLLFRSESETDPAWSPDGTWIAFAVLDANGESTGLFIGNPSGVDRIPITQSPDRYPIWSPNGQKLAFVSTRDGNQEIYVLRVDNDGPDGQAVRITDNPADDFAPQWSPNSKEVAFLTNRSGGLDIYVVSEKGENVRALTRNEVDERSFAWGPDGRIVFESQPTGKSDLFVMDSGAGAGGSQRQLSIGEEPSTQPDW